VRRVLVTIALLALGFAAASPDAVHDWWRQRFGASEPQPVTVYPYNFTGRPVEYLISPGLLGYLPAGAADGRTVLKDAYVPAADGAPLPVRWRYAGEGQGGSAYRYAVTLPAPERPAGDVVLTVRFYPDGEVAARYTTAPETAAAGGQVPYSLPGPGWQRAK